MKMYIRSKVVLPTKTLSSTHFHDFLDKADGAISLPSSFLFLTSNFMSARNAESLIFMLAVCITVLNDSFLG